MQVMGWDGRNRLTKVTAGHIAIITSAHLRAASQLSRDLVIVLELLSHILTGRGGNTPHLATTPVTDRQNSYLIV